VFIQAALNELWDCGVELDGKWGPQSVAASKAVASLLDGGRDISTFDGWMVFLAAVAHRGFTAVEDRPALPV
jgi:hypothetical protein